MKNTLNAHSIGVENTSKRKNDLDSDYRMSFRDRMPKPVAFKKDLF
jgi:hypothetical protein